MEARCKNCQYWKPNPDLRYLPNKPENFGECQLVMMDGEQWVNDSLAYALAEWSGRLATSPDFGCVQFREKEVE